VVSVWDSCHGVDLEVFVWADLGNWLNGSPVGEGGLSIVEPLVAEVLEVVVVDVSNALGNLAARKAAAKIEDLLTDLRDNVWRSLTRHKLVVESVAATVNLNVIQEVRVNGGEANTAVVHLSSEDLVTEEVVSEDTAVRVSVVEGLGHGNIGKITKHCMHWVVLLLHIVKMASVLVNAVATEHVLEKEEWVVVSILDRGSIIEDTNVGVNHLIISDEEKSGNIDGSLLAENLSSGLLGKALERSWNLSDEFIMVDVTSTNNNDVITEVVGGVEVAKVINRNLLDVVAVSLNWLAHHVLSVNIEMAVLKGSFHVAVVVVVVLLSDLLLNELEFVRIKSAVCDNISKKLDGLANITLEKRAPMFSMVWAMSLLVRLVVPRRNIFSRR
jgi:hypothetical protein